MSTFGRGSLGVAMVQFRGSDALKARAVRALSWLQHNVRERWTMQLLGQKALTELLDRIEEQYPQIKAHQSQEVRKGKPPNGS